MNLAGHRAAGGSPLRFLSFMSLHIRGLCVVGLTVTNSAPLRLNNAEVAPSVPRFVDPCIVLELPWYSKALRKKKSSCFIGRLIPSLGTSVGKLEWT